MHRISIISIYSLLIAAFIVASPLIAEAESVQVSMPQFPVTINGQVMENEYNQYPIIIYNNIVYLPMTYYSMRFMGIKTAWYEKTYDHQQVMFIGTDNITESQLKTSSTGTPNQNEYSATIPDCTIAVNTIDSDEFSDNTKEAYPILNFRDINYLPLTWQIAVEKFDFKYTFDSKTGLSIDSRDANRPILDNSKIGDTSPMRGLHRMGYVFSQDAYAGFPLTTLDDCYNFTFKKRGEPERSFSLADQLTSGDYYFQYKDDPNFIFPGSDIKPSLDGSILSVVCIKNINGEEESLLIKIDMETQKIISEESIGRIPNPV